MALDGKTPAQQANISGSESANWLSMIKKATKAKSLLSQ
jgi:hypothetical protein